MMNPLSLEENLLHDQLGKLSDLQPADRLQHSRNVACLSATLARLLDRNEAEIRKVYLGALLHDIGKQFISSDVLDKPGKLTEAEFERIQRHPWRGYVYLYAFVSDSTILNTVLYHHERWDGSGYPYGLARDQIPLEARICAVADVWDALISNRCYRSAWSALQASELLWAGAGSLFDPTIVLVFMKVIEDEYLISRPETKNMVLRKSARILSR
jgi:putative nucleotidyltransferase with HDIG domain